MRQTHPSPLRTGPRPLPLHLATATNGWISSRAGLPLLRNASTNWSPELAKKAAELQAALGPNLETPNPKNPDTNDPFADAVDREIYLRLKTFSDGINAYRDHPYQRDLTEPPVIWTDGATRLLDYGPEAGIPVLFVPSLINRAYILDLSHRRSLLRWMAAETGLRPLLLDWGVPGETERMFSLTDYISGPLAGALAQARTISGQPVPVVGYCMGGLLGLALAAENPKDVSGLVLMATPWNFHAERVTQAESLARWVEATSPLLDAYGELPVDIIQSLFSALDPFLVTRKFISFSETDPESEAAEEFVALEDWLNDGVPLSGPVARECMAGWYGQNTPYKNEWRVGNTDIIPQNIETPALVLAPQRDRIVPPASALALAQALPNAECRNPPLGHIGMVAASSAQADVWEPMTDWLHQL
ncbi:MAG: alpha/beta fold hydrolase [Alphaproteobacteria bacterium]|nr:alpha/beta fold hydrolase [Alphaproteobacteria bacterium]